VFVKPNLTFPSYRPGVMTSPDAVEAALTAILDYTPRVYVGDADSGGYNPFSMDEVYRETGLVERAARLGVSIVNLSREARSSIELPVGRRRLRVELPRLLTEEIDLLVTMPVPKMHANSTVSLTFKNQWGRGPGGGESRRASGAGHRRRPVRAHRGWAHARPGGAARLGGGDG
jgi:uncharacterized protein (DUF362 family)